MTVRSAPGGVPLRGDDGGRPRRRAGGLLVAAALALSACAEPAVVPGTDRPLEIDLARPWVTASVADAGGSSAMVERGLERARANRRMRSLLVARDGRLVVEEYFGGARAIDLHDVRSVTKSVVSALTGIALARGDLRSLDDPVADYLDTLRPELDPDKGAITIRHLLTMTSGLEWDETGGFGSYVEWIRSGDPLGFVLDRPFASPPGETFNYNSAAVHLLGVVIEQATSMELPALAESTLFDPIGVSRSRWEPLADGSHNGGAGLDLRPRDLARFGQLFLQRGASGGRQIVPADWVDLSTAARFDWRFELGALEGISYGYLWWVVPGASGPLHFAWGHGGQYVVVVPGRRLVVVATNDWRGVGDEEGGARRYERLIMDILVQDIIAAFR